MANVIIDDTYLTGIANAIRTKTGGSDTYTPAQMATAIGNISTGGGGSSSLLVPYSLLSGMTLLNESQSTRSVRIFGDVRKYVMIALVGKNTSTSSTATYGQTAFVYTPACLAAYQASGRTDGKVYLYDLPYNSSGSSYSSYVNSITGASASTPIYVKLSDLEATYGVSDDTNKYLYFYGAPSSSGFYPIGSYKIMIPDASMSYTT